MPWAKQSINGMLLDVRKSLWKEAVVTHEISRNGPLAVSPAREPLRGRTEKGRRKQRAGTFSCVLCSAAAPASGGVQG